LQVPSLKIHFLEDGTTGCSETSARKYRYTLPENTNESRSQPATSFLESILLPSEKKPYCRYTLGIRNVFIIYNTRKCHKKSHGETEQQSMTYCKIRGTPFLQKFKPRYITLALQAAENFI
jgi:hypothetical protein